MSLIKLIVHECHLIYPVLLLNRRARNQCHVQPPPIGK
jgi:hypothetical protein